MRDSCHDPPMPEPCLPAIELLALPESTPAALYGLYEVFAAVGVTWGELTGEPATAPRLAPRIVSRDGAPIATPVGLPLAPHGALGPAAEIVVVGDIATSLDFDPRGRWPVEAAWLRDRWAAGATLCSICTGAIVLAEAGLLDGEVATTHWSAAPLIAKAYPKVRLDTGRILATAAGGRLVTGGGASSWEDLALHLVARIAGGREAVRIARIFLFGDRSEGQLPFAAAPRPGRHEDAAVARTQAWIAEHYGVANPVTRMAERSGLSERTFKRRFKAATGLTPIEYVQTLRIEEAKQMLETGDQTTDAVACEVGYEDPAFFRLLFKRATGVTPARYRQRFARIARPA
jgi:transcriptional regulator GlxA family with amidase domain